MTKSKRRNDVASKPLLERLSARRDTMAKHVKELIELGEYKNADGWEFRLIELRHIIATVRRSNKQ